MSAREAILKRLAASPVPTAPARHGYKPVIADNLAAQFAAQAKAADTEVFEIASAEALPEAIQNLLGDRTGRLPVHVPKGAPVEGIPWHRAAGVTVTNAPPDGDAVAVSAADFALAETGTVGFLSGGTQPSSWHFLPGTECVLLRRDQILPTLEEVFARLANGLPATINLVTGPSRTADIEQTIERGAHGPRRLIVFLTTA